MEDTLAVAVMYSLRILRMLSRLPETLMEMVSLLPLRRTRPLSVSWLSPSSWTVTLRYSSVLSGLSTRIT